MKPSQDLLESAKIMKECANLFDENKTYRMKAPDGEIMEFSGSELIRTGNAFYELIMAGESGDDERIRLALQKVASIDCDS